jgi:cytoskeletal protein RodZ
VGKEISVNKRSRKKLSFKWSYALILLLVLGLGVGGFFGYQEYTRLRDENKRLSNPQESAKLETDRVKSEVANIIEVPTDEEPTIASVSDASKLSNQVFFAKAQNGDKLLMYSKAKKAILYRPSTKKIIEVAPINLGEDKTKPTATTDSTKSEAPSTTTDITTQPGIGQ